LDTHHPKLSAKKRNDYIYAYLMILPVVAGLLIFYIVPFFQTFYNSFMDMGAFGTPTWYGINNYKNLISDKTVWEALRNTLVYAVISVPVGICLSILLAVLLNVNIKGRSIYRTLFFLPCVTMPTAIAMVWQWVYNSSYGLLNCFLDLFGVKGPAWTTNPKIALYSIIIVGIWCSVGYNMIILLAGLQGIPGSYYEAADIDGAGGRRKFISITLPLLSSTIFFVLIMSLISAFQVFDIIFMMIPKDSIAIESTESLVYLFYRYGFIFDDKGYASVIAIMIFLIILIVTIIQMKLQDKWVNYE
jgi:multiple sugar transport system permease protein